VTEPLFQGGLTPGTNSILYRLASSEAIKQKMRPKSKKSRASTGCEWSASGPQAEIKKRLESRRSSSLLLDHFFALIGTANSANAMRELHLATLFTLYHSRHAQLEVSTALVALRLRSFTKRYCHESHLLQRMASGGIGMIRAVRIALSDPIIISRKISADPQAADRAVQSRKRKRNHCDSCRKPDTTPCNHPCTRQRTVCSAGTPPPHRARG